MPVSQEMRKENSYWVRRRDEWRLKYHDLVKEITYCKSEVSHQFRQGNAYLAKRYGIQLRALQSMANVMMIERSHIRLQLRLTSYRYE